MWIIDKIGMKSIKIALAVIVSLLVGNLFKFESPYLMALNSVIGIQGTTYGSFYSAKDRIVGTLIGITLGLITITFYSSGFIIPTVGVFIVIYICSILNLKTSVVQASVVFLSLLLFPSTSASSISVVVSTTIGVSVAIFINLLLSPFDLKNNLNKAYYDLRESIFSLCKKVFMNDKDTDRLDFRTKMMKYKELVQAYDDEEILKIKDKNLEFEKVDVLYENMTVIGFFIFSVMKLRDNNLSEENITRINKLLNLDIETIDYRETKGDLLLNLHVDKLLDYLEII